MIIYGHFSDFYAWILNLDFSCERSNEAAYFLTNDESLLEILSIIFESGGDAQLIEI